MTYRSDHDAALHRVSALEDELARLRAERGHAGLNLAILPPVAAPQSKGGVWAVAALTIVAGAGVVANMRTKVKKVAHTPRAYTAVPEEIAQVESGGWETCIAAIDRHVALDAASTDPHTRAPKAVGEIERTAAPCREQIRRWANDPGSAVGAWSRAEEEIVNAISLITVYYGSDPYAADNYASADQLWREYNRAVAKREAAFARITPAV